MQPAERGLCVGVSGRCTTQKERRLARRCQEEWELGRCLPAVSGQAARARAGGGALSEALDSSTAVAEVPLSGLPVSGSELLNICIREAALHGLALCSASNL